MKQPFLTDLLNVLFRGRFVIALVASAIVGVMVFHIRSLTVDNSFEVWFVDDDPALSSYRTFREKFGSDEVVVTTITDSQSVFSCERLKKLAALTDSIRSIDGVSRVMSLNDIFIPNFDSTGLKVVRPVNVACDENKPSNLQKTFSRIKSAAQFVSPDYRTVALFTWLDTLSDIDTRRGSILEKINTFAENTITGNSNSINHGGFGVVFNALNEATIHDGFKFICLSYGVIIVFLLIITRSIPWTIIAIASVTCANLTVFGLMGLFNRPVTMVSMALPPLVMVLGIANVIHISEHLKQGNNAAGSGPEKMITSLSLIVLPCLFNALTTAGGFLSLGTARMAVTRDYGIFAAIGVISALVFSIIGTLAFLKYGSKQQPSLSSAHTVIQKAVSSIMIWAATHRKSVCTVFLLIITLSLYAASQLVIDTYSINFLPHNHRVSEDSRLIEQKIGNYLPLEFIITPHDSVSWESPEFLNRLRKVQKECERIDHIDATLSIADVKRQFSKLSTAAILSGYSSGDIDAFRDSLEQQGTFNNLIDQHGKTIRLTAWVSMASAKQLTAIADTVLLIAKPILDKMSSIEASGYLPLYGQIIKNVIHDQIMSFSLALLVIFLLIGCLLRSFKMVLIALPSNLIPVSIVFGFMGIRGIRLDIATVTIAAAVLGIIVDDTVHILYNLKQQLSNGLSYENALKNVATQTGIAVVSTSIILISGFIVISFSGIKSVAYTGMLTALAVCAALLADILLLPSVASFVFSRIKK